MHTTPSSQLNKKGKARWWRKQANEIREWLLENSKHFMGKRWMEMWGVINDDDYLNKLKTNKRVYIMHISLGCCIFIVFLFFSLSHTHTFRFDLKRKTHIFNVKISISLQNKTQISEWERYFMNTVCCVQKSTRQVLMIKML